MTAGAGVSPSRLPGRSVARRIEPRYDAVVQHSRPGIIWRCEPETCQRGGRRRVVAMVAAMGLVVLVIDRGRGLLFLVMRMAVIVMRDRAELHRTGRRADGRTETDQRQREQADQQRPCGGDSIRHHCQPYKQLVKAR